MANPRDDSENQSAALAAAWRAAAKLLGIVWASPYTAFGTLIGAIGLCSGGRARFRGGAVEFHGGAVHWLLANVTRFASAMTWGHVILGRTPDSLDNCAAHERVHVRQYELWGPFFGPAYLLASAWMWMQGKRPYRDNPFEVEAYNKAP